MPGCLLSYLHFTNESVICAFQAGVSLHLVMVHQNCVHLFRHIPTNTPPLKNTTTQKYKYLKKMNTLLQYTQWNKSSSNDLFELKISFIST